MYSLSDEETEVAQRGYFGGVVEKPIRSNVLVHTLQESLGFLPSPGPFGENTAAVRQLQMLNDILKDRRVLVRHRFCSWHPLMWITKKCACNEVRLLLLDRWQTTVW